MYIRSDTWELPQAREEIEMSMEKYERIEKSTQEIQTTYYLVSNLTKLQQALYKTMNADKNIGTTICITEHATERAVSEHLGNERTYRKLSKDEAIGQRKHSKGCSIIFWRNTKRK